MVTFSTRRSLPHRQYSTREGKEGDEEINAVGLAGLRSWRKTGATRFSFLISNFRLVVDVVCFLLGNSPASEFYLPTFCNTLSLPSSYV